MPYRHPAGTAMSMLWWGIYFGCFGVWLGAVWGASVERIRARMSQKSRAKAEKLEYARPTGVTTTPSKWMGPVLAAQFRHATDPRPGASGRSGCCRSTPEPFFFSSSRSPPELILRPANQSSKNIL
jgi:hypothetical protein